MLHCALVSCAASNQSGRLIKPSCSEATPMHYRLLYICISWPRMNDTGDHFLWFSHGFTMSKLGALCHNLALPPARSFSAGGLFPRKMKGRVVWLWQMVMTQHVKSHQHSRYIIFIISIRYIFFNTHTSIKYLEYKTIYIYIYSWCLTSDAFPSSSKSCTGWDIPPVGDIQWTLVPIAGF